ncbi:Uncharacterized protein HZ326_6721 [Fusarium oxysporum f. sp. albedinis]|nr:Uncharacterized protein HZ326_6721 [Fusarium oxysporum f. sp. albedinis]
MGLPCIQVNEALAEEIGLEERFSRFWLRDHNLFIDVVAYQVILSEDEWQSAQRYLYEMTVTSFKIQYAANHVWGWHYMRILQLLGYW